MSIYLPAYSTVSALLHNRYKIIVRFYKQAVKAEMELTVEWFESFESACSKLAFLPRLMRLLLLLFSRFLSISKLRLQVELKIFDRSPRFSIPLGIRLIIATTLFLYWSCQYLSVNIAFRESRLRDERILNEISCAYL